MNKCDVIFCEILCLISAPNIFAWYKDHLRVKLHTECLCVKCYVKLNKAIDYFSVAFVYTIVCINTEILFRRHTFPLPVINDR